MVVADEDKKRIKRNLINRQRGMWLSDIELRRLIDILDGKEKVEDVQVGRQSVNECS